MTRTGKLTFATFGLLLFCFASSWLHYHRVEEWLAFPFAVTLIMLFVVCLIILITEFLS